MRSIQQINSWELSQDQTRLVNRYRIAELHRNRFAVGNLNGDTDTCRCKSQLGITENLSRLVNHLPLFLCVPLVDEIVDLRK